MKTRSQTRKEQSMKESKKIVIFGDAGVGKTNFINKYMDTQFEIRYIYTGKIKKFVKENKIIYDFPGQVKFGNYGSDTLKNISLCIVMYEANNNFSYKSVKFWIDKIKSYSNNPEIIIVCNKIDLNKNFNILTESDYSCPEYIYHGSKANNPSNNIYEHFNISVKKNINLSSVFERF